jgi:hypothetical protein
MFFADKIIQFIKQLHYTGNPLPPGIRIMNPYRESEQTMTRAFWRWINGCSVHGYEAVSV